MEGNSDLDTRPGKRILDGDELFSDLPECERRALLNDVIWSDPLKLYAGALPGDRPAYAIHRIVSRLISMVTGGMLPGMRVFVSPSQSISP